MGFSDFLNNALDNIQTAQDRIAETVQVIPRAYTPVVLSDGTEVHPADVKFYNMANAHQPSSLPTVIPADVMTTLSDNFDIFDTANQGNLEDADGNISMNDIEAILENPENFSPEVVAAAEYLYNNPSVFDMLETANVNGDGKLSLEDFDAFSAANPDLNEADSQALDTLRDNFSTFDRARGEGGFDQEISKDDLEYILQNPSEFSPEVVAAAEHLLHTNPYLFEMIEKINKGDGNLSSEDVFAFEHIFNAAGNMDIESYANLLSDLEAIAAEAGMSQEEILSAIRKIYYDDSNWNDVIAGAEDVDIPEEWLDRIQDFMRHHQIITINGEEVDIGHVLTGLDAQQHPVDDFVIEADKGFVKVGKGFDLPNDVFATYGGDIASAVAHQLHNGLSYEHNRDEYFSDADVLGDIDAWNVEIPPGQSIADALMNYYDNDSQTRFTDFVNHTNILDPSMREALIDQITSAALGIHAGTYPVDDLGLRALGEGQELEDAARDLATQAVDDFYRMLEEEMAREQAGN